MNVPFKKGATHIITRKKCITDAMPGLKLAMKSVLRRMIRGRGYLVDESLIEKRMQDWLEHAQANGWDEGDLRTLKEAHDKLPRRKKRKPRQKKSAAIAPPHVSSQKPVFVPFDERIHSPKTP